MLGLEFVLSISMDWGSMGCSVGAGREYVVYAQCPPRYGRQS